MNKRWYRSAARFAVRPHSGSILPPSPKFTLDLVADNDGGFVQVSDEEVIDAALQILARRMYQSIPMSDPKVTRQYLTVRLSGLEYEVLYCLYLNVRRRIIGSDDLFRGTLTGASVHIREVVKEALRHNAAAVILAHNHPSGDPEPSDPDRLITAKLKQALELVDIRLLDHVIVGGAAAVSMAERGLL